MLKIVISSFWYRTDRNQLVSRWVVVCQWIIVQECVSIFQVPWGAPYLSEARGLRQILRTEPNARAYTANTRLCWFLLYESHCWIKKNTNHFPLRYPPKILLLIFFYFVFSNYSNLKFKGSSFLLDNMSILWLPSSSSSRSYLTHFNV